MNHGLFCFIAQLICDQFFSSPFLLHGLFCVGHCDNLFSLGPFCWKIISPTYLCFILLSVLVLHFDRVIKQNNQTNQMKIATIYNYQETCILCTIQCQELGATGRQLSFKLCCSRDTARTMYQCISNNYQYPKYILSYLILSTSPLNFSCSIISDDKSLKKMFDHFHFYCIFDHLSHDQS